MAPGVVKDEPGEEEEKPAKTVIKFKEKPAVIEERTGAIEFRVVANDNQRDSMIILTGLKCIFQKQLPKMPRDYIARLVYDRTHLSIAIVKKPLEVVGGITYRPFKGRQFAEIVFCAISSDQQVKGYGAHLMSHLKDYVKATSDVMYFLTYADNYAIGYFKKQGFTKEITLDKSIWMGYIKDYEGGTLMQCSMLPRIKYLEAGKMLAKQKECVHAKIRAISRSHIVYGPPKQWKNGIVKIDPLTITAIKESGWSPEMDEMARQPKHAPHFAQLQHILNEMQNHPSAWPFQRPVSREDVADYYEVIKEPMDLETMENRLEADYYATPEDFIRDAKLVFNNCRSYNNETTTYFKNANKLEKFLFSKLKEIPEWSKPRNKNKPKNPKNPKKQNKQEQNKQNKPNKPNKPKPGYIIETDTEYSYYESSEELEEPLSIEDPEEDHTMEESDGDNVEIAQQDTINEEPFREFAPPGLSQTFTVEGLNIYSNGEVADRDLKRQRSDTCENGEGPSKYLNQEEPEPQPEIIEIHDTESEDYIELEVTEEMEPKPINPRHAGREIVNLIESEENLYQPEEPDGDLGEFEELDDSNDSDYYDGPNSRKPRHGSVSARSTPRKPQGQPQNTPKKASTKSKRSNPKVPVPPRIRTPKEKPKPTARVDAKRRRDSVPPIASSGRYELRDEEESSEPPRPKRRRIMCTSSEDEDYY
ncbi:hypothetical protein ABW20_dc0105710 [Dactylellina cionopaga]|nr:hypothetical protein ABW20_dc0105710 [Dactylellina cionopaga]